MATTLNMTLLLRRAAFADTCILQAGEPGYHTGTKEFKVGDGKTQWSALPIANKDQIQAMIDASIDAHKAGYYTKAEVDSIKSALQTAINGVGTDLAAEVTARTNADTNLQTQINTKLASADFTSWKNTHESGHAKSATEITAEIAAAVLVEENARKAADKDITDTLGTGFDKSSNTVAKKIAAAEASAKSHAESKASAAQSAAIAEAESKDAARAQAATNALNSAVSALETKIETDDAATLKSAKDYTDEKVAAEAKLRSDADNALDARLDKIETFIGAADADGKDGGLYDALDTLAEIQKYITDEGAAADQMVKDIAQNATDIDALEERMGNAESNITTLGTNKVNVSDFNTWKQSHEQDHANKQTAITSAIATAKSEAITEAGNKDTALHTVISKEIDDDVKAAIDAEVIRADAAYDATGSAAAAQSAAITEAGRLDGVLKTAIEGVASTAKSSDATIAGAKKYAEEKAEAARSAAVSTAAADATTKANNAKSGAISEAKSYTDGREVEIKKYADQAEADAISAVVGTANDEATADTIKGVKKAFAAADTTVLNTAQAYADNAVKNNIKAGNDDIVVSVPTSGTNKDKTVVSHKVYGTGSYTAPAEVKDTHFVTGVNVSNGHVTGASVKSLAEALAAMEFIFDGGTSAN